MLNIHVEACAEVKRTKLQILYSDLLFQRLVKHPHKYEAVSRESSILSFTQTL